MAMLIMVNKRQTVATGQTLGHTNENVCASSSLADAILDSLTANVALVDSTGVIITANAAWKRFANDNRCSDRACYICANYLSICEEAVRRDGDLTAAAALNGIRGVLRHEQDSFTLEYPCHAPDKKRWFRLRATRLSLDRLTACVVAHEEITTEKIAEEALREAERQALTMAHWFAARPEVARVLHPALPDCPGHEIWKRDFSGSSGLFSVILKPFAKSAVAAMLDGLELFGLGYSWGGFESLVVPFDCSEYRTATKWNPGGPALRFSIGLEDVADLQADLDAGFARLRAAPEQPVE